MRVRTARQEGMANVCWESDGGAEGGLSLPEDLLELNSSTVFQFQENMQFVLYNGVLVNQSPYLQTFRFRVIHSADYVAWPAGTTGSTGPPGWESIPGLLKRFTNTGSVFR